MWPFNYDNTGVTVELDRLLEMGVKPWEFVYPSYYTGEEKTQFEQKVLDHYRFRQIGQETAGRWLHYFRTRIREIMPYYIQLYESAELMASLEDPFGNVDITETFEQETGGNSSVTSSANSSGSNSTMDVDSGNVKHEFSNTPQGTIENLGDYLTEASKDTRQLTHNITGNQSEQTESTASGTESGTVTSTLHRKGNQGVNTYAHDMKELRETFLNIDLMIINELNDLFLQVY